MTVTVRRPSTRKWTVEEYNRMAEVGLFKPGERVELIEGEIVELVAQNKPHADAISWTTNLLVERFGRTHLVRVQLPVEVSELSEPEPDFSLVPKEDLARARRHPTGADLVIEVADSSLGYDRSVKGSLYARRGIPEYWILNVLDRCLEVYLSPSPDPEAPFGWSYADRRVVDLEGSVTPSFLPPAEIRVREMLEGGTE